MQAILLEGPREEPLSIEEVKAHLRLTGSQEDALLELYIQMSRTSLEEYLQQSFLTQTWKVSFSSLDRESIQVKRNSSYRLPNGPIQKILLLEERTKNKDRKLLPITQAELFLPNKIVFKGSLSMESSLEITYVVGLSETKEKLSSSLRYAILLSVAQLYEQRSWEGVKEDIRIRKLLAPYKYWSV